MSALTENSALHIVNVFVEELYHAGVRDVCISPGSRSTPLTMAFARSGKFAVRTMLDERSAAFFALGVAKGTGKPVVLVCTSGTATANYLPAIMEARQTNVPLLVLTADRPPELHDVGANQTVRQAYMYNDYVKWSFTMPVPAADVALIRQARATAWRSIAQCTSVPEGPVHVNWPFREPLIPPTTIPDWVPGNERDFETMMWGEGRLVPTSSTLEGVARALNEARRGLIVCGPQSSQELAPAIVALAKQWNVPILADALSQIRYGPHATHHVIDGYDVFLREKNEWDALSPDVIVRLGRTPTSKVLGQFLSHCSGVPQIVVTEDTEWADPFFTATHVIQGSPEEVVSGLTQKLTRVSEEAWLQSWQSAGEMTCQVIDDIYGQHPFAEGRLFRELARAIPDGANLFVGNSMPVRDLDALLGKQSKSICCYANRGVSGIDGIVSSALGVSAGTGEPTVLVIGDVSFYHDLNGLLAAKKHSLSLTVILVNNDGGGIFSYLPQAQHPDTFTYFKTEHGLDFQHAMKLYGGHYTTVSAWDEFHGAVANSVETGGVHVIELRTSTDENVEAHRALYQATARALEALK